MLGISLEPVGSDLIGALIVPETKIGSCDSASHDRSIGMARVLVVHPLVEVECLLKLTLSESDRGHPVKGDPRSFTLRVLIEITSIPLKGLVIVSGLKVPLGRFKHLGRLDSLGRPFFNTPWHAPEQNKKGHPRGYDEGSLTKNSTC